MRSKKKLFIILIIGLFFFVVQMFFISYHRISSEITLYNFTSENTVKELVKLDKPYEIVFYGLNDSIIPTTDHSKYIIKVYVDRNTSLGSLRYLPLFKPVSFTSEVTYKWSAPKTLNNVPLKEPESGKFDIRGNCNLLGYYSSTKAEQIINELISKSIVDQIQKDLNNRLNI